MTNVRPSRALFNSALFAIAAFLSFSLAFLACRGDNAEKERERLQSEIEQVNDSLKFYQEEFLEKFNKIACPLGTPTLECLKNDKSKSNPAYIHNKNQVEYFTHIRDSLHRHLKELPPPK